MSSEQCTVYVLKCKLDKYYVGRTQYEVCVAYNEHFSGKLCNWTKLYPPVDIVETISGDKSTEDVTVLHYIEKYGLDNVRGGSYSSVILDNKTVVEILKKINIDYCCDCNKNGHFASECPDKKIVYNSFKESSKPSQNKINEDWLIV